MTKKERNATAETANKLSDAVAHDASTNEIVAILRSDDKLAPLADRYEALMADDDPAFQALAPSVIAQVRALAGVLGKAIEAEAEAEKAHKRGAEFLRQVRKSAS